MIRFYARLRAAIAAPALLALAACGGGESESELPRGEPIAAVPAPEGQQWSEIAEVTPEDGYRIGNPDAPLKLMEYASLTCPACARFSMDATVPLEKYLDTGVVSYEIRNQVHNVLDLTLAMLVRCGQPESYHPLSNQVWANLNDVLGPSQTNGEAINAAMQGPPEQRFQAIAQAAGFLDFFAARGISRDQAMQCLADPAAGEAIANRSQTQSEELGVTATPTFFLNGRKLESVVGWKELEPVLQNAGAR
jgi:protein-disulfide isomerase